MTAATVSMPAPPHSVGTVMPRSPSSPAWHGESSDLKTHAVGQVKSNGHGIFDLMGNAREWVAQDCSLHRPRCRKALDETLGQTCSSFISMGGEWLNRPDLGSPGKVLEKTYDVALQLAQSSD